MMRALLGYWLVCEAITIFVTVVIGSSELDAKIIVGIILFMSIFFTMLCVGCYLMTGGK